MIPPSHPLFILSLSLLLCFCVADPLVQQQWTGTLTNSLDTIFQYPDKSGLSCEQRDYVPYASRSLIFDGNSRMVVTLEPSLQGTPYSFYVWVYGFFDPEASCSGYMAMGMYANDLMEIIPLTGNYTVVVHAFGKVGNFTIDILSSNIVGTLSDTSYTWSGPNKAFNTSTCTVDSESIPLQTIYIAPPYSGYFDISLFASGSGLAFSYALYNGHIEPSQVQKYGACTSTIGAAMIQGSSQYSIYGIQTFSGMYLTANTNYTLSFYFRFGGKTFGFEIVPTRYIPITSPSGFSQPLLSLPCTANTNFTDAAYSSFTIQATHPVTTLYIASSFSHRTFISFAPVVFVFSGSVQVEAGQPICGNSLIAAGASGYLNFTTVPSQSYTVIVSTANGSALDSTRYAAYIYVFGSEIVGGPSPLTSADYSLDGHLPTPSPQPSSTQHSTDSSPSSASYLCVAPLFIVLLLFLVLY